MICLQNKTLAVWHNNLISTFYAILNLSQSICCLLIARLPCLFDFSIEFKISNWDRNLTVIPFVMFDVDSSLQWRRFQLIFECRRLLLIAVGIIMIFWWNMCWASFTVFSEKVILFLTDGEQSAGGDPLSLIADRNGKLGNKVTILTYGLGSCKISSELLM